MTTTKEDFTSNQLEKLAPAHGDRIWRNNRGVALSANGRPVRFGLANDSAALGKKVRSSDFIGIRKITITPDMVGQTIGQFISLETKKPGWVYSPNDEHSEGQQRWHNIVNGLGGHSVFVTDAQEYYDNLYKTNKI